MSEPSKYAAAARYLLKGLGADAVLVIVLGGPLGSGCARAEMPAPDEVMRERRALLVKLLRHLADDIEKGITQPDQPEHRRGSA
jgi:hypothetical protein